MGVPSIPTGSQSVVITIGTTKTDYNIGFKTTCLLLRSATTNTANINVNFGSYDVLGGNLLIRPGESINFDITQVLILKVLMGSKLKDDDFITKIAAIAGDANQTLYLDAIGV